MNRRSRQLNTLARSVLKTQKAPLIGRGLARWNFIHVHDLSTLFRLLAEAAAIHNINAELWGAESGYYLAENEDHAWGDIARWAWIAAREEGLLKDVSKDGNVDVQTVQMDKKEALDLAGFEALSWGMNSRGEARRAKKYLGWKPEHNVREALPGIVRVENEALDSAT